MTPWETCLRARDLYMAATRRGFAVGFNQLPAEERARWFALAETAK